MLNENAKRWVEALRSGEYTQGRRALHSGDTFCCLGVACDLAKDELGLEWVPNPGAYYAIGGADGVLPPPVRDWLGLRTNGGGYESPRGYASLASRNDGGASFAEIADLIESEPQGLFE